MKRLNRRQILERMATVTGGVISISIISACDEGVSVPKNTDGIELKALNRSQLNFVADIADAIIPDTDTPGAKAVNVHYLIDELVANWMVEEDRVNFLNALTALDERIKTEHGSLFADLTQEERGEVLDQLGVEMIAGDEDKHIYKDLRELTIYGYYTSEVGASEELIFDPIPGDFKGCMPHNTVGRAWSVDQ